jgi:DeoR/GlpR family transcriptional regulator of sugar metabolism
MIKEQRHRRILSILHRDGTVDIALLRRLLPEVAVTTFRRDLGELAEAGALRRTHGGAVLPDAVLVRRDGTAAARAAAPAAPVASDLERLDAVILPPVGGRGSEALRRDILRRGIPFIAESAPQAGGSYLGPDNRRAGFELGLLAAAAVADTPVAALVIGLPELVNTRDRAEGFLAGLRQRCAAPVRVVSVNGQGTYKVALRVAQDALLADPAIGLIFAVNDHSAIAGIEAAARSGRHVRVFATGGESPAFLGRLAEAGPLCGVAAFFPEVVGRRAIDLAVGAMTGTPADPTITPHAVITPANLTDYYAEGAEGWQLRPEVLERLSAGPAAGPAALLRGGRIGFMPHYPAHDWYRSLTSAMQARCAAHGVTLVVTPPHQGIAAEIARLRREIAADAAGLVRPGAVVALCDGQATGFMAEALRQLAARGDARLAGVTIVTNAFDILHLLEEAPMIKVILTSGEYQRADRCLVGPSIDAIFERLKPDLAFVAADGLSTGFGLSVSDERRALAASRFIRAARRTIVLADSTILGSDAHHRAADLSAIDVVLADPGTLPVDRQNLRDAGLEVIIAGEPDGARQHEAQRRPRHGT